MRTISLARQCAVVAHFTGNFAARFFVALAVSVLTSVAAAQTAEDYRRNAIEFSRSKSWDQAIVNYRKALELEPGDANTHYNLALALKYSGRRKERSKSLNQR